MNNALLWAIGILAKVIPIGVECEIRDEDGRLLEQTDDFDEAVRMKKRLDQEVAAGECGAVYEIKTHGGSKLYGSKRLPVEDTNGR